MRKKHFTLIEILMVIAVILILAAIGIGGMSGAMRRANEADTRSRMEQLKNALDAYYRDHGHYPVQEESGEINNIENELGGYLDDEEILTDSFNRPFRYQYPGDNNEGSYDLWSRGGGDAGDEKTWITNW